jgi:trimeric autotransporter adhesin
MKPLIKLKTTTLLVIPLVLACFALLPRVQAAMPELLPAPAPDGFYNGFNTAEGLNALFSVNTAVGQFNTALGFAALKFDTTGAHNTAVGGQALLNNNGSFNTAVGENALVHNTTGGMNMALGQGALANNKTGSFNTAMGFQSLNANTVSNNTAVGYQALRFNTVGDSNTAVGFQALFSNTEGDVNIAVGRGALSSNTIGNSNTAVGVSALPDNISGIENTAVGGAALFSNVDGSHNIAVGQAALSNNTSGSNNIAVGEFAGLAVTTSHNVISIGVQGQDISNSCFIGNIFNAMAPSGSAVFIDANNRLGTITSSKRFKEDIKPIGKSSEALLELKPVTFRYKKEIDPAARSQFGLVAEEVEKVNPDLVVRDKEGKPYSVRYDQINAMLLNEFLKAHRQIEEQQKEIEALRTLIQKVSDKVEMNRPAPQVVNNNQ